MIRSISAAGNNLFVDKINLSGIVGINEAESVVSTFEIFPNPMENASAIELALEKSSDVKMELFDLMGRKISSIADHHLAAGTYHFAITQPLQDGVYFVQLTSGNFTTSKRLVVLH